MLFPRPSFTLTFLLLSAMAASQNFWCVVHFQDWSWRFFIANLNLVPTVPAGSSDINGAGSQRNWIQLQRSRGVAAWDRGGRTRHAALETALRQAMDSLNTSTKQTLMRDYDYEPSLKVGGLMRISFGPWLYSAWWYACKIASMEVHRYVGI